MLLNHENSQHTPPFRCRFCSSMFSMLKFYKIHLNFHKRRTNVPDRKSMQNSSSNNKQWNKSGANTNVYASHANAYRTSSSSVQTSSNQGLLMQLNYPKHQLSYASPPPQQPMRCKYCHKQFGRLSSLKKHEMVHESIEGRSSLHLTPDMDLMAMRNRSMSRSSNEHMNQTSSAMNKSGALTLTPSLLSNLNKLANLGTTDTRDGKKPAILININTNDSSAKDELPVKSQEMPVGGSASGLMISSVSSVDKNYFEKLEKNALGAGKATVMIQNGKKAISLSDLQCPICKKIVSQPFSLKIHLRTHTMER
jgi:Zinc finger, C2H2 type